MSHDVSSITLTYNEEENIAPCLRSVDWCDEHIVVDSYSTDDTVEIAREHGANVFMKNKSPEADSYEILYKYAVNQATNNTILRIDADERSTTSLNNQLKKSINSENPDIIRVPRKNYVDQRWVTGTKKWWPDYIPMIFREGQIDITDEVHYSLTDFNDNSSVITFPADEKYAINHFSYSSYFDVIKKRKRWAYLESEGSSIKSPINQFVRQIWRGFVINKRWTNGIPATNAVLLDAVYYLMTAFFATCRLMRQKAAYLNRSINIS